MTAPLRVRYPALDLWRREIRAGLGGQRADMPGSWRYDALWRAATWEQAALEAERCEMWETWAVRMRRARETLAEAVAAKQQDRAA